MYSQPAGPYGDKPDDRTEHYHLIQGDSTHRGSPFIIYFLICSIIALAIFHVLPGGVLAGQRDQIPLQDLRIRRPSLSFKSLFSNDVLILEGFDPAITVPIKGRKIAADRIVIDYTRPNTFNNIGLLVSYKVHSNLQQFKKTILFPSFAAGGTATIDLVDLPVPEYSIERIFIFFIGSEESIRVRGLYIETLNDWERMLLPWERFWQLDEFEPYTINSLRGPQTRSGSANGVLYAIIAAVSLPAVLVGIFFTRRRQFGQKKIAFGIAASVALAGIAFYDGRMTAEFTGYTKDNYQYWVAAPYQHKNYKKVYANLPLFTDWTVEEFRRHGVTRYLLECPRDHYRYFFDYQVYPAQPTESPTALVFWRSPFDIRSSDIVEYGNGKTFRFSRKLSDSAFPNSAIFISEATR